MKSLDVKRGYFVFLERDLHGGLDYHGPYDDSKAAVADISNLREEADIPIDDIRVVGLPYVVYNGIVYALSKDTSVTMTPQEMYRLFMKNTVEKSRL